MCSVMCEDLRQEQSAQLGRRRHGRRYRGPMPARRGWSTTNCFDAAPYFLSADALLMKPPIEFQRMPPRMYRLPPHAQMGGRLTPLSPELSRSSSAAAILQAPYRPAPSRSPSRSPPQLKKTTTVAIISDRDFPASRPTTAAVLRTSRRTTARVEWDLAGYERRWILSLRYRHPSYHPATRSSPILDHSSSLLSMTTASRMQGAATLSAMREIPYSNATERWQNNLRVRKGQKHAYSNYAHSLPQADDGLTDEPLDVHMPMREVPRQLEPRRRTAPTHLSR